MTKSKVITIALPPLLGLTPPVVYENTLENAEVAVKRRVLGQSYTLEGKEMPRWDEANAEAALRFMRIVAAKISGEAEEVAADMRGREAEALDKLARGVDEAIRKRGRRARKRARKLDAVPSLSNDVTIPLAVIITKYTGRKRQRYIEAYRDIIAKGWDERWAIIIAFIKAEKIPCFDGIEWGPWDGKRMPDPRVIQFRTPQYTLLLSSHLEAIEHALYTWTGDPYIRSGLPVIGKTLNHITRGQMIRRKMLRFKHCVVVSLDMSRFDMHVGPELLKIEHQFYKNINHSEQLAKLLKYQISNKCKILSNFLDAEGNSHRYDVDGNRMSGDKNTAMGNCILCIMMLVLLCEHLGVDNYDILDDGDDILWFLEDDDWSRLSSDEIIAKYRSFGMTAKVEAVTDLIEEVLWCQGKPVEFEPGEYRMTRHPFKVMTNTLTSHTLFHDEKQRNDNVHSLGVAELALNQGVPILQEYAIALIRNSPGAKFRTAVLDRWKHLGEARRLGIKLQDQKAKPVTLRTRNSYARAWGISVTEQLRIEEILRNWQFDPQTHQHFEFTFNVQDWSHEQGTQVIQ